MSSLNVDAWPQPWRAYPGPETTIAQITNALVAFPDLALAIDEKDFSISFVVPQDGPGRLARPPETEELAAALFGDDEELIVAEDTGTFPRSVMDLPGVDDDLEAFDAEARDRNAEGV